jgi:hypothetical protein
MFNRVVRRQTLVCLFLSGAAAIPAAAANRYLVDRVVGTARISGFVETNGAIGPLVAADIVDWDLTVDADGNPDTPGRITGPQSGGGSAITILDGQPLTATTVGLFFDFTPNSATFQICTLQPQQSCWQLVGGAMQDEFVSEANGTGGYAFHGPVQQQIASSDGPSFALGLTVARVRLNEDADDRLRLRALFNASSCGDGIDPAAETVAIRMTTPAGTVYPPVPGIFPIQPGELELHEAQGVRRWSLTAAARLRTGIERLDIDEGDGTIVLVDRDANLPVGFHEELKVEIALGNDLGSAAATLVEEPCGSGRWRVGR